MESFEEKEMYFYDSEKPTETFGDFITKIPIDFDGYVFYKIRRDPIGQSGRKSNLGRFISVYWS